MPPVNAFGICATLPLELCDPLHVILLLTQRWGAKNTCLYYGDQDLNCSGRSAFAVVLPW